MDQELDLQLSQREITHCLERCSLATPLSSDDRVITVSSFLTGRENMIVCQALQIAPNFQSVRFNRKIEGIKRSFSARKLKNTAWYFY